MESIEYCDLPLGRVRYSWSGPEDGPVVVFIHGMSYPMEVFTFVRRHLAQAGFRTLSYDLFGRGFSSFSGGNLESAALFEPARVLASDAAIAGKVHLVTLSNADLVAVAWAAAHPSEIASISFIAPSGEDPRTVSFWTQLGVRLPVTSWADRRVRTQLANRMATHLQHAPANLPRETPGIYDLAIKTVRENPDFTRAFVSHTRFTTRRARLAQQLNAMATACIPVVLLNFAQEADSSERGLDVFRACLPDRREILMPEGTHMGLIECPAAVNMAVCGFIEGCVSNG